MALVVNHHFVSGIPDDPTAVILGMIVPQAHWNSNHDVTGSADPNQGGTGIISYSKGDLIVSPGGAALNKLAVGSNGQALIADATQTNGVKWGACPPTPKKASNQSFTSTTILANITNLFFNVQPSRIYSLRVVLQFTCAAAGGIQVGISGTATVSYIIYSGYIIDSANNGIKGNAQTTTFTNPVANSTTTGTAGMVIVEGYAEVSGAGTLNVQAAQSVSNGTPTVILQGSTFAVNDIT